MTRAAGQFESPVILTDKEGRVILSPESIAVITHIVVTKLLEKLEKIEDKIDAAV